MQKPDYEKPLNLYNPGNRDAEYSNFFFLLPNLNLSFCSFSPLLLILYCKGIPSQKTCVPMNMISGFCCLGFSLQVSNCSLFTSFS